MPGTTKPGGCGRWHTCLRWHAGTHAEHAATFLFNYHGQVGHPGRLQVFNGDCQMAHPCHVLIVRTIRPPALLSRRLGAAAGRRPRAAVHQASVSVHGQSCRPLWGIPGRAETGLPSSGRCNRPSAFGPGSRSPPSRRSSGLPIVRTLSLVRAKIAAVKPAIAGSTLRWPRVLLGQQIVATRSERQEADRQGTNDMEPRSVFHVSHSLARPRNGHHHRYYDTPAAAD